jgi:hypothetical protein
LATIYVPEAESYILLGLYQDKFIKDKFHGILALKLDGFTLITESEKADAIASKFSLAHDNTLRSELSTSVRDICSVLNSNAFNDLHTHLPERLRS